LEKEDKLDQKREGRRWRELRTVREINKACRAYAFSGSGHPVYCTAEGYDGNVRVRGAKTVGGVLWVRTNEHWIIGPHAVFLV
jgi:hypothetical protein